MCSDNFNLWTSLTFSTSAGSLLSTVLLEDDWLFRTPWRSLRFSVNTVKRKSDQEHNDKLYALQATATISAVIIPKVVESHRRLLERFNQLDTLTRSPNDRQDTTTAENKNRAGTAVRVGKCHIEDTMCVYEVGVRRTVKDSRDMDFIVDTEVTIYRITRLSENSNFNNDSDNHYQ